jgi:hypothetical protein
MSSSEHMTLSLHYYGQGRKNEQHARITYDTEAKTFLVTLPEDMQDMVRITPPPSVGLTSLSRAEELMMRWSLVSHVGMWQLAKCDVDITDLTDVVEALRANERETQAIMQAGATRTKKNARYHLNKFKGKGGQQPPQTKQRTSSSGSGA